MDSVYLELLLGDASAAEYEVPARRARERGEPASVVAELERARSLALRLRTTLERRRRRENELGALFQTASDLAGLREVDAVLRAIVRRARRLLDTDVAYLTLEDVERGDTYMRVTNGSVAATFQRVRLPLGAGLGGLVFQTTSPYASADYGADGRFQHTGDIDGAVRDEGLVAILGVPLRLGARVIGVLFAADRSRREFAPEEVALLGSLADHAAVAIDSARMLQETRAALAELDAAGRLGRARTAAVERAADAHDRLTGLVLRGGGLEQLAASVTEVLRGALWVLDADGSALAQSGAPDIARAGSLELSTVDPAVAGAIGAARESGRTVRRGRYRVAPVVARQEYLGALVLRPDAELDDADQRILERAALVTALLLLLRRSAADAEARVCADLLADILLAPGRDPTGLRDRAHRLGLDLDDRYVVVAVTRQERDTAPARLAVDRGGLSTRYEGRDVLLLPGTDAAAVARSVVAQLRDSATAGAAGPASGPEEIAAEYRNAVRCVDALRSLGRVGEGASMAELGFLGLILGEHRDPDAFVADTIGPLLDYDRRRGTDLVDTLDAYFSAGRSATRARAALHVHTNTVTQRLERVGALLGPDWQHVDRTLEIQLALRLHHVARARPAAGRARPPVC